MKFNLDFHQNLKLLDIEKLDIDKICRICLNRKDYIFSILENGLLDLLTQCSAIKITNEDGVYLVCSDCANEIKQWHDFLQRVMNSQIIGRCLRKRQLLNNIKTHNIIVKQSDIQRQTGDICKADNVAVKEEISDNIDKPISEESTFECSICMRVFNTNSSFNTHMKTHEIKNDCCEVYENEVTVKEEISDNQIGDQSTFQCAICMKVFDTYYILSMHMKTHDVLKNYCCEICEKKYYNMERLIEHMRSHTGERPFTCEHCPRTFTRKKNLRMHIRNIHNDNKQYPCEICGKRVLSSAKLKVHLLTHSKETPFTCDHCGKSFKTKHIMQVHVRCKHTDVREYLCADCGKVFNMKSRLDEHMRKHTGDNREPRHICQICGKISSTSTALKIHIKAIHTNERPFACEICEKTYVTQTNLNSHMKTHSGEKSCVCSVCGKDFVFKSSLKCHERIHKGERPYQCTECGKTFTQGSVLKTHMKVHVKLLT